LSKQKLLKISSPAARQTTNQHVIGVGPSNPGEFSK